jgi:transcriptional regulator with XRE-family HTH domain
MNRDHPGAVLLVSARRKKNLTQAQLAVQAGVSPSTVSLAERTGLLTHTIAEKLAGILGVTAEELLQLLDTRERAARPWLPSSAPARTIWIGPDGEAVRVNDDGTVTPVVPGGHPRGGIASEPTATSERPR